MGHRIWPENAHEVLDAARSTNSYTTAIYTRVPHADKKYERHQAISTIHKTKNTKYTEKQCWERSPQERHLLVEPFNFLILGDEKNTQ